MARRDASEGSDAGVRRGVGRTLATGLLIVVSLGVIGAWAYFGLYQLEPGQNAIIFQFGEYQRTEAQPGLRFHLPPPIQSHEIVNVASIERVEFGATPDEMAPEVTMQTSDNNIVHLSFVVQYRVGDAFKARYRIAEPIQTLRDASQAAVREVVGRNNIDGVLSDRRGQVEEESQSTLQTTLDQYESGLEILAVQLQEVQPPRPVRDAFDDVIAAAQDRSRATNEAQGYANEVLPEARGRASELRESAQGYRDAVIAESRGEAERFTALLAEYRRAPEVIRRRLYLETMEAILPAVEKVIIENGGENLLPYLPIQRSSAQRSSAPVPPPAPEAAR